MDTNMKTFKGNEGNEFWKELNRLERAFPTKKTPDKFTNAYQRYHKKLIAQRYANSHNW